jgi:ppGpp synthetase/RelA/SpoT-type nucleotidyltranferase
MEIIEEVHAFLKAKDPAYRELLVQVTQACMAVKNELGGAIVRTVYGRDDKQATGIFKSPVKIAKALNEERFKKSDTPPAAIQDIIGVTIVVHYPNEIQLAIECLKRKIRNARLVKDAFLNRNGYHAHHLVFRSTRISTIGLHCEVQIKTMLHDAWAAKTHDLNYKPRGRTDDRLSRMMQVFGDALQSIELQSELLRDMIQERWNTYLWNADLGTRRIVRQRLFEYIPNWRKRKGFSNDAEQMLQELASSTHKLMAPAPDEAWLSDLVGRINDLGETALREATWLAIQLAMTRESEEFISFANGKATDLAVKADELLVQGVADFEEIATLPLAVAAYGDWAKAIELSRYLAEHTPNLTGVRKETVLFNLANLLVEQSVDGPPLSPAEQETLKTEVIGLIGQCEQLREADESAFVDLEGLLIVAASNDSVEIRKAIDQLQKGRDNCPPEDREYAEACFELNARVAWRRLLEVERQTGRSAERS